MFWQADAGKYSRFQRHCFRYRGNNSEGKWQAFYAPKENEQIKTRPTPNNQSKNLWTWPAGRESLKRREPVMVSVVGRRRRLSRYQSATPSYRSYSVVFNWCEVFQVKTCTPNPGSIYPTVWLQLVRLCALGRPWTLSLNHTLLDSTRVSKTRRAELSNSVKKKNLR